MPVPSALPTDALPRLYWVVSAAYLVILGVATTQWLANRDMDPVAAFVPYGAAMLTFGLLAARRPLAPNGPEVRSWIEAVAVAGSMLGVWLVVHLASALPRGLGIDHGYYRVKVEVTSPLGDHNTAAGLLLVAVVAAAITATHRRRGWWWLGATTAGMVASLSRGGALVLVMVAGAAWLGVAHRRIAPLLSLAAATSLAGVLALAAALGAAPPPNVTSPDGALGASVIGRFDLALRGVEVAAAAPWLGAGFGSFDAQAANLPEPNHHAHQQLAHAAAEAGVLVAVAVALLAATLLLTALRLPRSPIRDLTLLGGGALVAHAQVEILGGLPSFEVLVAVLLALALRALPSDRLPAPDD